MADPTGQIVPGHMRWEIQLMYLAPAFRTDEPKTMLSLGNLEGKDPDMSAGLASGLEFNRGRLPGFRGKACDLGHPLHLYDLSVFNEWVPF